MLTTQPSRRTLTPRFVPAAEIAELVASKRDGRLKLFLTGKILNFRRDHRELFARGEMRPREIIPAASVR